MHVLAAVDSWIMVAPVDVAGAFGEQERHGGGESRPGWPTRPSGMPATWRLCAPSVSRPPWLISVSTDPGASTFTVMPYGPELARPASAMPITAALAVA